MKRKDLKSFDIASYDIEIEYNNKLAPITKKIERLNNAHETKSLKAHKDFLAKEQKSKQKLNELSDKAVIKDQRIEKAAENKLKKLRDQEHKLHSELQLFKDAQKEANDIEIKQIHETKEELRSQEELEIKDIQEKYKINVETYYEKLETYNSNFENNKQKYQDQIKIVERVLYEQLDKVSHIKETIETELTNNLSEFLRMKEAENEETKNNLPKAEKELNKDVTNVRKMANAKIKQIDEFIAQQRHLYIERYEAYITELEAEKERIRQAFLVREELINTDLQINVDKLQAQIDDTSESKNKRLKKNNQMKLELFQLRAATTISYEQKINQERFVLIDNQIAALKQELEHELLNVDRLHAFMKSDQQQLKDTTTYMKTLNYTLKQELTSLELGNNNYLMKHENLKIEFIRNYARLFNDFKQALITMNRGMIEQIADINAELDDINKYLDTAEPLKEIEVNRLREDIEVSEVKERYKIKYTKQDHEIKLLNNALERSIQLEEIKTKKELATINKEITKIKNKELYDKAIEKAKLKYNKAQEIHKLRTNNTRLERRLLDNSYKTELEVLDFEKEIARLETHKTNLLISKEIENEKENIELEAKYKIEVINKRLEEDILKLDEAILRIEYDNDTEITLKELELSKEKRKLNAKKQQIEQEIITKRNMIDTALEREIREPLRNITRSQTIIDERLGKLVTNNAQFATFISEANENILDENLTIAQIKDLVKKDMYLEDRAIKYINKAYAVLDEAMQFMNQLEERRQLNVISSTADQNLSKRLTKNLEKTKEDHKNQYETLEADKIEKINQIKTIITEDKQKLSKQKTEDLSVLREMVYLVYNNTFEALKEVQNNIKTEVELLYNPLIKADNELIENAKRNAEIAKQKIDQEQQDLFTPLKEEFSRYESTVLEEITRIDNENADKIQDLKGQIQEIKQRALNEVQEIETTKKDLLYSKNEQLRMIEESEEKNVVGQLEIIDQRKKELDEAYQVSLQKLDEKDQEATKIFQYEERIYQIAQETAQARLDEATNKTENTYLLIVSEFEKDIDHINKTRDAYIEEINTELLDATNNFERNIFTVRPRLEESIGDAQKAIDTEIENKKARMAELQSTLERLTQSLENNLYSTFVDGYERLHQNLSFYLDKYRAINDEFIAMNNQANNIIETNTTAFQNALFDLAKNKHEAISSTLREINEQLT